MPEHQFPPLRDNPEEIREFANRHPVAAIVAEDLRLEIEYWQRLLEARRDIELTRARNPAAIYERRLLRWGGLVMALAGIPACFAAPVIGLPIAVVGACLTVYDVVKQLVKDGRSRASTEAVDAAVARREALIAEFFRR
jgi:hypothetical protein